MTFNQARIIELEGQLASQSQLILELSEKLRLLEEQNSLEAFSEPTKKHITIVPK